LEEIGYRQTETDTQDLKKMNKKSGKIEITDVIPVIFVPMTGDGVKQRQ
jgi:hypothetical protein